MGELTLTLTLTMTARSFHVSVNTKMSSAPTQRMRKMPMSSNAVTWF